MSHEPSLHEVTLTLCELCIAGRGGECHVPGCALYMNRAPDIPIVGVSPARTDALEAKNKALQLAVVDLHAELHEMSLHMDDNYKAGQETGYHEGYRDGWNEADR